MDDDAKDLEILSQAVRGQRGEDQQRLAEVVVSLAATLLRKNHDYGSSAWSSPLLAPEVSPRSGIMCRMSDKVCRVVSLLERPAEVSSESLTDTIKDLAGYCCLWLGAPHE